MARAAIFCISLFALLLGFSAETLAQSKADYGQHGQRSVRLVEEGISQEAPGTLHPAPIGVDGRT